MQFLGWCVGWWNKDGTPGVYGDMFRWTRKEAIDTYNDMVLYKKDYLHKWSSNGELINEKPKRTREKYHIRRRKKELCCHKIYGEIKLTPAAVR